MNATAVVLVSISVSLLTTVGVLFGERQFDPFGVRQQRVSEVPQLAGLSEEDARTNLLAHDLNVTIVGREVSAEVPPGHVVSQSQPPGQRVLAGQIVALKIAAPLPDVPAVVGRGMDEATALIEAAGFRVEKGDGVPSETVEAGKVLKQSPEAGSPGKPGLKITLHPSLGKQTVEMPKVSWIHLSKAKEELEKVGLALAPLQWVDRAETPSQLVLAQDPKPGTELKAGTEVKLVVNAGD